ncbi:hypothetical protein GGS26DRAFT_602197 [Hypomontagnella submonticulosa]|nr:hypothetical protein GGS26DRAFT_602197 [Hypomontagnella submonticulosa]
MPSEICLRYQEHWTDWIESIQRATPLDIWMLIDPNGRDEPKPRPTIQIPNIPQNHVDVTIKEQVFLHLRLLLAGTETSQWQHQEGGLAKAGALIQATVHPTLYHHLDVKQPIRAWLLSLETSLAPTIEQELARWEKKFDCMTDSPYVEWPANGPELWLREFEEVITRLTRLRSNCTQRWPEKFVSVWESVDGSDSTITYINNVVTVGLTPHLIILCQCCNRLIGDYDRWVQAPRETSH